MTTVKKSRIEGFEDPKSVRSEPQVIETPERSRFKGELSARPFELGTSALRTVDGDKTIEGKSPFGVTTVKKGTIESFKIPVPHKLEPETKQDEKRAVVSKSVFEWGRPLLGGSSDEEDYGEEEREYETGENSGRQPVYLEKDPSEVSILLQRSERKIVKPEEVIEEYVDEEGRQVKRISKVTTTKTITRSERRLPVQKMDFDVPSEPGEDVEEYTDENGQRVRRVVRTSFATIPKTVLRDGAVKVVLKPGDPGQRELREGPAETERIHTFTSDDGRRTQKLTKTTLATQLKRTVQPVTVQLPSPASLPIHDDDQPPMDEDENANLSSSFEDEVPMEVDAVKDDPHQPVKNEAPQIEPVEVTFPVAPSEDVSPDEVKEYIDENGMRVRRTVRRTITTTTIKKEDQGIEPVEGTFPVAPSEDVSPDEVKEYIDENGMRVRRTVRRTITTTTIKKEDQGIEPVEVTFPVAPSEDEWPEEVEEYIDENGMRERRIVRGTITTTTIKKEDQGIEPVEGTFPIAPSEDESPEEVEEYVDENGVRVRRTITTTTIKKEDQGIEPVEVTFPVAPSEDESPEEVEEYIDENGMQVRRIVRRTITATTMTKEDQGIEPVEVPFPVAPSEDKSPEEVKEYIDENGVRVRRIMRQTITSTTIKKKDQGIEPVEVPFPPAPSEDESPDEIEEYIDENGMRVRRIVRRTITTTTMKKEDQGIEPVEVTFPVTPSEDQSPEEVEEYIDENGMRVRRIVRRTIITTTIKKEDQGIEPVKVTFPVAPSEDESPEEVEEYIDENGMRVRRIVRPTITTTTIKKEDQSIEPVEVPFPVAPSEDESPEEVEEYIDENGMRVRRIVKRTITTTTIEKEDQGIEPVEVTFPVAPSEHESPEQVEEYIDENGMQVRRIVRRTITATTMKKEDQGIEPVEVPFPVAPSEDESPEEVEEYIYENGMRVRRIVRRTITTRTIKKEDQGIEPVEVTFPVAPSEDESPEEVEEYIDENGVRVRKILRRTITSTTIKKEVQGIEPVEVPFPVAPSEDESPEEIEEYIDENGMRVKRIVRRTITTTTMKKEDRGIEPVEVTFPVAPSEHESPEEVEEYIDENGMRVKRIVRRTITTTTMKKEDQGIEPVEVPFPVAPSEDESPEEIEEYIDENGMRVRRIVRGTITTPTIEKEDQGIEPVEVKFPVAPSEHESPEEVEEYIDENGMRVKRIVRRTITTTTMKKEDQGIEPVEVPFPVAPSEDESPEEVEEYIDENGMRVRRIVRGSITTPTIEKEDQGIEPLEVKFPVAPSEHESPEEVEEYIDENGMQVRRIVRRTITATTMKKEDQGIEPVEVTFPVAPSEDESPEEVEEYIDENGVRVRRTITARTMKKEDEGIEPVKVTLPLAPSEDQSPEEVEEYIDENGMRVRRIVRRTITTTTMKKEDQGIEPVEVTFPVAPSEHESPEQVEEYIDENGMQVRRIVRRTITATTLKKEDQGIEPVEVPFPVAPSEDESPEEVEEYIYENGMRVRRIVRRTITTRTIKKEDQGIEPVEVTFPVAPSEDESPEEVEEYIDENGVRVRKILRRTITSTTIKKEDQGIEPVEVPFPVAPSEDESPEEIEEYIDENGMRVKRIVRRTITTTTMKKEDRGIEPVEVTFPVAPSEHESPEEVEEYIDENGMRVKRIVRRTITTTTMKKEDQGIEPVEVPFPVAPSEDESPEEIEEYIDENGMRVRRIVRGTITTPTIEKEDQGIEPVEVKFPVAPSEHESPEEVEEYIDENGMRVKRIVRRTITTTTMKKEDQGIEPVEVPFPVAPSEDESPEEYIDENVEEYIDENGMRVRRIVRGTITTPTIEKEDQGIEPLEVKFPVAPSEDESPEEVEEYIDENGMQVRRIVRRTNYEKGRSRY